MKGTKEKALDGRIGGGSMIVRGGWAPVRREGYLTGIG